MNQENESGKNENRKIRLRRSCFPHLIMAFVTTLALLTTVSGALAAARYEQSSPAEPAVLSTNPADPKLFDKVAFYPERNIARAFADLRIVGDRVALIIPQGDTYETERQGQIASADRTTEFMIIMADKDLSIDAKQMAPSARTPGILNLKDLTVQLLIEKSFVIEKQIVYFAPSAGALIPIGWQEDNKAPAADMKGRECWHQLFLANAGALRTSIGRRT
jgi:hypothetical protein